MPALTGTSREAGVRALLARTDTYFSQVGLLPVLLPLPIQGDCGALKRGLLRSCILCSDRIHLEVNRALKERLSAGTSGGAESPERAPSGTPLPSDSPTSASSQCTRRNSGGSQTASADSPRAPPVDPVEKALLPAKVLREKLRIIAAELDDPELQQEVGPPILSREELGLPYLRKVLECLDSSRTEGVLLLLCERRSPNMSAGPYRASLDTLLNATAAQRAERQELFYKEQQRQPKIQDWGLGAVAGGLVTVAATGQRQLMCLFCIEELPDDARHQLVRVLAVRVMALAFVWPSVFCTLSLHSDDDLRAPGPSLLHFPRPARDFLCLPSGLQLSRHYETEGDADSNHTDQVRGCACVKRMHRKVQQQTGRAKQDVRALQANSSLRDTPNIGPPCAGVGAQRPPAEWHEFWAVSKRRFYSTWAQRGSQLVPDDPANSLIEAFGLPLKFPHVEQTQKSPGVSSPTRRRGGTRTRRGRSAAASSSDAAAVEVFTDLGYHCRAPSRGRGRPRGSQSRQQQGAAGGIVQASWESAAAPSVPAKRCIDPTRPAPEPTPIDSSDCGLAVKREGTALSP